MALTQFARRYLPGASARQVGGLFRPLARLVARNPAAVPGRIIAGLDVRPRLGDQVEVEMEVVQRQQRAGEDLVRHDQVQQLGPGEIAASVIVQAHDEWEWIGPVALVAQVDQTVE